MAGGTSPYTYSLDNITYQNSNIFNNLSTGNYTVYIKGDEELAWFKIRHGDPAL